jgi:regulator of ribonuclease activity A
MPIATAEIHDAHPDEVAVCDAQFRSFGRRLEFAGPCVTLKCHEDHRRAKALIEGPGEGRVLVIDAGGSLRVGIMGDTMAALAAKNGWAGAVIFGAIRDSAAIDVLDFGVKALGTTARRSGEDLGGVVGQPVGFGGVTFAPGAWVYADRDAVIVAARRFPEVAL